MQCKYCDKETVFNTSVCHQHGGHKIRYGTSAPNYKHGERTKEARESRARLRALSEMGNGIGMFHRKMVGRKPNHPLIHDVKKFKQLFKELYDERFKK